MDLSQPDTTASFAVTVEPDGTTCILVGGELDTSNADEFRRVVEDAMSDTPATVVFDLSEVSFMDSSALAVLLIATRHSARVHVRQPSPIVRQVIEITGLAQVLGMQPA